MLKSSVICLVRLRMTESLSMLPSRSNSLMEVGFTEKKYCPLRRMFRGDIAAVCGFALGAGMEVTRRILRLMIPRSVNRDKWHIPMNWI